MDEQTTPAQPAKTPASPWGAASIACIIALAATGGAVAMLRAELRMAAEHTAQMREKTLTPITQQLQELDDRVNNLAAPTNGASADALKQELDKTNTALAALTARVDAMENKPAPAPVVIAPPPPPVDSYATLKNTALSGAPYAKELDGWIKDHPQGVPGVDALRTLADAGIPTETALREQLRAAIPAPSSTGQPAVAEAVNTRLAGLISIRKQGEADPYAALRASTPLTDLPSLIAAVNALPEATRAPLIAWRDAAQTRQDALAALAALASIAPTPAAHP